MTFVSSAVAKAPARDVCAAEPLLCGADHPMPILRKPTTPTKPVAGGWVLIRPLEHDLLASICLIFTVINAIHIQNVNLP